MEDEKEVKVDSNEVPHHKGNPFFKTMAAAPWPFLVLVPIFFGLLLGFGWSKDEKVEQEVSKLWIPQDGSYASDQDYAASLGVDDLGSSAFAALALSRDGGNMLTAERLALVRDRMRETEGTEVREGSMLLDKEDRILVVG